MALTLVFSLVAIHQSPRHNIAINSNPGINSNPKQSSYELFWNKCVHTVTSRATSAIFFKPEEFKILIRLNSPLHFSIDSVSLMPLLDHFSNVVRSTRSPLQPLFWTKPNYLLSRAAVRSVKGPKSHN